MSGLRLRPQVELRGLGLRARADLVDEDRRLVCEADSSAWHGGRRALADDAERYDAMVVNGWTVLRFSWEQVMLRPHEVHPTLSLAVERTERAPAPPA